MNVRAIACAALTVGVICAATSRAAFANTAPGISGTPPTSVMAGQSYSFRPTASDAEGQSLSFSVANKPVWASFDAATGRLYGAPSTTYSGIKFADVRISVSDGIARSELPAFDVAVELPNRPPVISGVPLAFVKGGDTYTFTPTASDPDRQRLVYTISGRPSWATFDPASGRLQGIPAALLAGTVSSGVHICVTDGFVSACLPQFQVRVVATNRAPSISGTPKTSATVGAVYGFAPVAADPDANPLTFMIRNKPAWAVFDSSTGRLSGVPDTKDAGTIASDVRIGAFDGYLKSWLPEFSIRVYDAPVASGTVTLSWARPTSYTDGSPLKDLQGYTIYYGVKADRLTHRVFVGGASATSTVIEGLPPATWYFALRAITRNNSQSALSRVVSKRVP